MRVAVHYDGGEQQFLRVGQRYLVTLLGLEGDYHSGVGSANQDCSYGTFHADGSAIETSLISRPHVKQLLFAIAIAPVVTLLLLAIWLRRRHNTRARVGSAAR